MARVVWSHIARDNLKRITSYRELVFGNYRVIYRHSENTVTIVTVIHGARILRL
jgi:plasmid stabilization system protein ParE